MKKNRNFKLNTSYLVYLINNFDKMRKIIYLIIAISFYTQHITAQSAKRFYSDAKASITAGNLEEAIDYLNKAITTDPKFYDAYIERGNCFMKQAKLNEAITDYKTAATIEPKEISPLLLAGDANLKLHNYSDAYNFYIKVTEIKKKYYQAFQSAALCKMNLHNFSNALSECDKAIEIDKSSALSYLYKGMCYDSLNEYKPALENYTHAVEQIETDNQYKSANDRSAYVKYFIGLGNAQAANNLADMAHSTYTKAIGISPDSYEAYELRGKINATRMKMSEAEADYNQSITIFSKNPTAFAGRAYVYSRLGDYEKAISDYEKSIILNKNNPIALKGKAQCLESLNKINDAQTLYQEAYNAAKKNNVSDLNLYEIALKNIREKVFQSKREGNRPTVEFVNGDTKKMSVVVPKNNLNATLDGKIMDESNIEKIMIGEYEASFDKEKLNPSFSVPINLLTKNEVEVYAKDVYGNELKTNYKIVRAENEAPKINLSQPLVSAEKIINLTDSDGFKVKLNGSIEDESYIKSLVINGYSASYSSNSYNPTFNIDLDIVGVDSIQIVAIDEFDNKSILVITLKRNGSKNSEANPMGKTWAVFIDNAKYSQLPMLEASSNDVMSMKSALQAYNIEQIIVKSDLTKQQMEKFFSTELRDLVNTNNVSSLMIFYAGHGKFINEVGYWLPVDANKKDEFSFFNVSSLKNHLVNYKPLTHSLVVSDACETGPAFYLAMRDANKLPECGQWESAKKKSAQILTSTTIDLNDDKSVFTKSFVNALKTSNDKCISIEKVTDKIGKQSIQYQKPKPKLGIIPTLNNDDDATFFFIRK